MAAKPQVIWLLVAYN